MEPDTGTVVWIVSQPSRACQRERGLVTWDSTSGTRQCPLEQALPGEKASSVRGHRSQP